MKTSTFTILIFVTSFVTFMLLNSTLFAEKFQPSIVILTPYQVDVDESLKGEIAKENYKIDSLREEAIVYKRRLLEDAEEETDNIKLMYKKQIDFMQSFNFFGSISVIYESYLQYALYETYPNLIVYASDIKSSGKISDLGLIADSLQVQYIVNFSKVNIFKDSESIVSNMTVQLYDNRQKKIILHNEYLGNSDNPGIGSAGEDGAISCTFSNISRNALKHITNLIFSNQMNQSD